MPGKNTNETPEEKIAALNLAFGVVADSLKMYYSCLKTTGMPDDIVEKLVIGMQMILMAPVLGNGGINQDE